VGSLPHRQTLLFLGAVIVPSVVLVGLGIRAIGQETELAEKRAIEDRQRAVALVRQELLTRLESIKLRVAGGRVSPTDRDVSIVARVASGQLILPWEDPSARPAPAAEQAQADLLRAATLQRQGNRDSARAIDRKLLRLNLRVSDEYGVPFALYAAKRLSGDASVEEQREITACIAQAFDTSWLSPPAAYLIVELVESLRGSPALRDLAAARAGELEQAGQLAAEVPLFAPNGGDSLWVLFGKSPWLVGMTGLSADQDRLLVAVRAKTLLDSIKLPEHYRWALDPASAGENLGERFAGLKIAVAPAAADVRSRSRGFFYLSALVLVVSVTVFSAYLLNRDVRREARLAALRSQFVSSVSHELKTPISTIRACAELLNMGRVEGQRATSEYLKNIIGESERLSRLVDGVLDFSKIEQGSRSYRFSPVALDEIVRSAVQALAYPLAQGGFELHLAVDCAPPVKGDRAALEQAVTNLLTNAMKYSGDHREIGVSVNRQREQAVIRVQDHGVGIAPEEQRRIFERFYRAPAQDAGNVPGAGLGLTLVDHVVRAHGGRVMVESQPGQGSVFSILLPVAEEA
jgi:signal transduction histidine kinase